MCVDAGQEFDLLPANKVQQRDVSWCISKLMNVFTHTYTRLKVFASIVVHLLSVAESLKTVYQSLLAQNEREREREREKIVMEEEEEIRM